MIEQKKFIKKKLSLKYKILKRMNNCRFSFSFFYMCENLKLNIKHIMFIKIVNERKCFYKKMYVLNHLFKCQKMMQLTF